MSNALQSTDRQFCVEMIFKNIKKKKMIEEHKCYITN